MFLLPHGVHGLRHLAHDVNAIEHDLVIALRQALLRRGDVGRPHVHGDGLQAVPLRLGQWRVIGSEALGAAFLGDKLDNQSADADVRPLDGAGWNRCTSTLHGPLTSFSPLLVKWIAPSANSLVAF
jgi:hypothetical protein